MTSKRKQPTGSPKINNIIKATETAPSAAAYKSLGVTAFSNQNYLKAISHFSSAIELSPLDATLFANRSASYSAIEQFHSALIDAESAIQLRPDWSKGYYRRGIALEGLMKFDEALKSYQNGLKYDANDQVLLKGIADIELVIEELKNAEIVQSADSEQSQNPESDKFQTLVEWLRDAGARFSSLYLRYYSQDYRGVHALRDIKKDTIVLYVPNTHIMTSELAKASSIGQTILNSKVDLNSTHTYLASFLLQEREKGSRSFWVPYINILPTEYNYIPLFFSVEELKELKGSFTLNKIVERKQELREEYDNLCKNVDGFSRFTHDDFVWSRLVVITRIFGLVINGHKTDGLVPYADMLNHMRPRQTSWTYNDQMNGFTITAIQPIARSEQVYDSYGRKCNSRFFVNYGFALEENEDNQCSLIFTLPKTDPHFEMKSRLLEATKFGTLERRRLQIPCDYREEVTKEAFSILRFFFAHGTELMLLNSESSEFDVKKIEPISLENELKVLEGIHEEAKILLNDFPTTIEEDTELLKNKDLSFNMRNIILMRRGEKEVLKYYIDLYPYCLSLSKLPWKNFKRMIHKCYEMKQKSDPYITAVIHPLKKSSDNGRT